MQAVGKTEILKLNKELNEKIKRLEKQIESHRFMLKKVYIVSSWTEIRDELEKKWEEEE